MTTTLDLMLADMESADPLYRPTDFWRAGLAQIVEDLRVRGIASFRSHPSAHEYYVPLYRPGSSPWRGLVLTAARSALGVFRGGTAMRLQRVLAGEDQALADYRVVRAADASGRLAVVGESTIGQPIERIPIDGKRYSRSLLNYLRALALLARHADMSAIRTVLEIGGGYGTLGEIATQVWPDARYVDVDIPPVAAVATYYLSELVGTARVLPYESSRRMPTLCVDLLPTATVLCPWQLPRLTGDVDLFVNLISFQEMEPSVVANYVHLVQRHRPRYVLLRGSRHGKAGTRQSVTVDGVVQQFGAYRVLARDHAAFGDASLDGRFVSEVVALERTH